MFLTRQRRLDLQYVVVIDYSNTFVKFFKVNVPSDVGDMESYLAEHYGYDDSTCYYMSSDTPINVEIEEGAVRYDF